MKNAKKMTFEESGETITPYTSLPSKSVKKCSPHDNEKRSDFFSAIRGCSVGYAAK